MGGETDERPLPAEEKQLLNRLEFWESIQSELK
ncbi:MAG: hypothetical protein ACJAT3_000498 [Akkermansiaceae bacterium]|jgi:hypothetical protein